MNAIEKEVIGIPELVSIIVSEFSFMQSMQECDNAIESFKVMELQVNLNFVHKEIQEHLVVTVSGGLDSELDMILDVKKDDVENIITYFLEPYSKILDVTAMQQNIHNKINWMP